MPFRAGGLIPRRRQRDHPHHLSDHHSIKFIRAQRQRADLRSLPLGLVFGFPYKIAETGVAATFVSWFVVVVFGFALGLITSSFYDFADKRMPKVGP